MAKRFISYQTHPALLAWAAEKLGVYGFSADARTISQLRQNDDGTIDPLCVVVLDRWTEFTCEANIASDGKAAWASKGFVQAVYEYVFNHAKKLRINMQVSVRNTKSINMQEALPHERIGLLRDSFGEGHDGILYGCTKKDYLASKWHKKPDQREKGHG